MSRACQGSAARLWTGLAVVAILLLAGCGPAPTTGSGGAAANGAATKAVQKYHCPMHPTYIKDGPGTCPICNMDLVPLVAGGGAVTGAAMQVSGREIVHIDPARQQQIGVMTAVVSNRAIATTLRIPALVEFDETRYFKISPRVGGWIRSVHIAAVGQAVARGEPLFRLYSPELLATEKEYLQARASGEPTLIAAGRQRLALWNLSDEQIAAIETTGKASDTTDVLSPVSGVVIAKMANEGQAFMAGEILYEVADLSRVWLQALVPEADAPLVATGMLATVSMRSQPDREDIARVSLIYPQLDETTRRLQVRIELDNPDLIYRPNMWASVELETDSGEALCVPPDAVIDTGRRAIAFVVREDGHFEPREVKVGRRSDEAWEVRSGLAAGERVVTRALFLVDAESQLRAAVAAMLD